MQENEALWDFRIHIRSHLHHDMRRCDYKDLLILTTTAQQAKRCSAMQATYAS
jgi:hypothetical protein